MLQKSSHIWEHSINLAEAEHVLHFVEAIDNFEQLTLGLNKAVCFFENDCMEAQTSTKNAFELLLIVGLCSPLYS